MTVKNRYTLAFHRKEGQRQAGLMPAQKRHAHDLVVLVGAGPGWLAPVFYG